MNVWNFFWLIIELFLFFAYIVVVFHIVGDLFRDRELAGMKKALWVLGLLFIPFVTALAYLILRGDGMAQRQHAVATRIAERQEAYLREVAGTGPAQEIAAAKSLLDSGAVTEEEFAQLKAKALA